MLDEIGITVKASDIPEMRAFREAQAKTNRGLLWRLFHWWKYNRLVKEEGIASIEAQRAFLNAVMNECGKQI